MLARYEYMVCHLSMNDAFNKTKEEGMNQYQEKMLKLAEMLGLKKPGDAKLFNDELVVIIPRDIYAAYNETFAQRPTMQFGWKPERFCMYKRGRRMLMYDIADEELALKVNHIGFNSFWFQDPTRDDFNKTIFDMVFEYVLQSKGRGKPLVYKHYPLDEISVDVVATTDIFSKPTKRVISNKNLCKIDRLLLTGDVSGLYGTVKTLHTIIKSDYTKGTMTWGTFFCLSGNVNGLLYGCVTNIHGAINNELIGDISGISGDVTNLIGDCTGVKLHIRETLTEKTNVRSLLKRTLSGKVTMLSNEDSFSAYKAYRKLAHCTLGLTEEERKNIDCPNKVRPPFEVDRWGRYYFEYYGDTWVFSINPVDIMFLKELGPLNSCFCITCLSAGGRWGIGMRSLMALNCANPNLGCIFRLNRGEPIRKMKMFKGFEFNWFKPDMGSFFQYNKFGNAFLWSDETIMLNPMKEVFNLVQKHGLEDVEPIHGHDGINHGHERQKKLSYLELYIGEQHSWVEDRDENYKHPNKLTNNTWDVCFDENWNEVSRSGVTPSEKEIECFIEEAKMVKELVNGIEI